MILYIQLNEIWTCFLLDFQYFCWTTIIWLIRDMRRFVQFFAIHIYSFHDLRRPLTNKNWANSLTQATIGRVVLFTIQQSLVLLAWYQIWTTGRRVWQPLTNVDIEIHNTESTKYFRSTCSLHYLTHKYSHFDMFMQHSRLYRRINVNK